MKIKKIGIETHIRCRRENTIRVKGTLILHYKLTLKVPRRGYRREVDRLGDAGQLLQRSRCYEHKYFRVFFFHRHP